MKGPIYFKLSCAFGLVIAVLWLSFAPPASGQIYTLNAPYATLQGDNQGLKDWVIGGSDYLNQQLTFFRIGGSGAETMLSNGSFVTNAITGGGRVTYTAPGLRVRHTLGLNGANWGESSLRQDISIQNLNATSMDLYFFLYSDFSLPGGGANDSVVVTPYTYARISNLAGNSVDQNVLSLVQPYAAAAGNAATLLADLQNGTATTLSGPNTAGPGDTAWTFAWHVNLAGNQGINLSILYSVPEPSCGALAALGLLVAFWRKRI